MNKYLLKIIELLDKEGLVDKEDKLGCIIEYSDGYANVIGDGGALLYYGGRGEEDYDDDCIMYISDIERYEEVKIIGQIHLGHILQWFHKKGFLQLSLTNGRIVSGGDFINLYLGKPPMERDEEQCKELYNFIIKCTQKKINTS